MKTGINYVYCILMLLVNLLAIADVNAEDFSHVNVGFKGHFVGVTHCSINNDQPITVSFGNVGISKVASGKYIKDMHYNLTCDGVAADNKVTMVFKATPTSWDNQAMVTSADGLGVYILRSGTPVDLNTAMNIDPESPPQFQVQLIKDPATDLTEQAFTAVGTLMVEYI